MDSQGFDNFSDHLGIEKNCWDLLIKGAHKSKEPFHFPVFGTQGIEGPELRTIVLRKAIRDKKQLIVHTDIRAEKIKQIEDNSNVSLLFYDKIRRVQLRIKAVAQLHFQDDLAKAEWENCRPSSRRAYLGKTPGNISAVMAHGLPEHLYGQVPSIEESEAGFVNFAVISCKVTFIDWLWLYHQGHRRAQFTYDQKGEWSADWVMP